MNYPKISIVTPSYNQAGYLEETIRSVIDQNYPNLEYIVIDGGSTDGSVEVIKKYADKITFWVSEKDKGQYDAINKGFSHTTGEIMGWINSSDIYYPWTLHTIAEIFEQTKEVQWIHGMPTNLGFGNAPQNIYPAYEKNIYDMLSGNHKRIQQESVFWKRALWDKVGGQLDLKVKYAGDFKLWLDFFRHEHLYYVRTILGGFRFHDIRRGGDGEDNSVYGKEATGLYKEFRSKSAFSAKMKGFITRIFVGKNRVMEQLFKRLGLLPWYRRYRIVFDFDKNTWRVQK
jgi:glycosyltransferase involved in cell wall biosynthesis